MESKHTRVFPRFQPESRKLSKSALAITSIEPLEERPKQTEREELRETLNLLPVKDAKLVLYVFILK